MRRYSFIGPVLLITVWTITARLNLVDTFFLPDPFETISELVSLFMTGSVIPDLLATVQRVMISFLAALGVGIPLGLWLGQSQKLYRSFEFIIDFFRSTPASAIFPLFLLIFGITDKSKIAVATFSSLLIIVFNTAHGVMLAKVSRVLAAKIMGATKTQIFRWVLFWESLPQTFIGLRSSASLSLVVIIVTEMFIGTSTGIGRRIIDAQITYEIKTMYAVILLAGIVGYLLNLLILVVEKRVLHWTGK